MAARPPSGFETELQAGAAGELLGKPGGVFLLAADRLSADDAVLLAAAARAVLGGGRGSLADQLDHRPAASAPAAAARDFTPDRDRGRARSPPGSPKDLLFWNGFGGFTAGWSRVRDRHRRHRPWWAGLAAGPVDQRAGQPGVRMPGDRGRPGLHLGGQQPDEPPHAVVERPVFGPAGRGDLPARRGNGRGLDAHAPAVRTRRGHDRPPWPGLHSLHARQSRAGSGRAGARPARRPGQARVPHAAKQRRPAAPPVGDVLCRMGARHRSRERPAAGGLRARSGSRCRPGPERLGRQLRRAGRLPGHRPVGAGGDRGSHGIPRPQWFRVRTRRAGAGRPLGPRRPGARPGRGGDDGDRAGPRRGDGSRLRPGPGGKPGAGPPPHRRPTPPPVEPGRCWPRCSSDGITS